MAEGEREPQRSTQVAQQNRGMIPLESSSVDSERHTAVRGSVYLIVNDLIQSRVKIGYTTRDPIERASELVTTGTTGTFVVIYQALVLNPYAVEQEVHRRLRDRNRGLEWFEVCPNRAKEMIHEVAGEVLYEDTTPRWHRSQPEPSNETKELLREAKQAADERRRLEEEAARRERLAAEEARIQEARELAEKERFAQEAEYQRRAEEQARAAVIEEARLREKAELARLLEEQNRLSAIRWRRFAWYAQRVCVSAILLVPLYIGLRPYSEEQIQVQESRRRALASEVTSLRREVTNLEESQRAVAELQSKHEELAYERRMHRAAKAEIYASLAEWKRRLDEARSRLDPSGKPIPGKDGLWPQTSEAELVVQSRGYKQAMSAREAWLEKDFRLGDEIEKCRAALIKAEASRKTPAKGLEVLDQELKAREVALEEAEKSLNGMKSHNALFPWLRASVPSPK